jgi:hypothetical protein
MTSNPDPARVDVVGRQNELERPAAGTRTVVKFTPNGTCTVEMPARIVPRYVSE